MTQRTSLFFIVPAILMFVFLLVSAVPSVRKSLERAKRKACMNNLRQLAGGKGSMSIAYALTNGTVIGWADIDPYVKGGTNMIFCPLDPHRSCATSYDLGVIGEVPVCRIDPSHNEYPKGTRMVGMQIIVDE